MKIEKLEQLKAQQVEVVKQIKDLQKIRRRLYHAIYLIEWRENEKKMKI